MLYIKTASLSCVASAGWSCCGAVSRVHLQRAEGRHGELHITIYNIYNIYYLQHLQYVLSTISTQVTVAKLAVEGDSDTEEFCPRSVLAGNTPLQPYVQYGVIKHGINPAK